VSSKDHKNTEVLGQEYAAEDHSFDELAKGIANGALSRGQLLKLVGAAVLGSVLNSALPEVALAKKKKKKKKHRHVSGVLPPSPPPPPDPNACSDPTCTPCGGRDVCGCVSTIEGKSTCVDAATGPFTPCTTSATCQPSGRLCVNIGPSTCDSTAENFVCALPCTSSISPPPPSPPPPPPPPPSCTGLPACGSGCCAAGQFCCRLAVPVCCPTGDMGSRACELGGVSPCGPLLSTG
jgi:hypothetical protein